MIDYRLKLQLDFKYRNTSSVTLGLMAGQKKHEKLVMHLELPAQAKELALTFDLRFSLGSCLSCLGVDWG